MIKQIDDYDKATNLLVEVFVLKYFGGDENTFTWYKFSKCGKLIQCKVSEGMNFKVIDGDDDGRLIEGYWSGGRLTIDEACNYTIDEIKLALELGGSIDKVLDWGDSGYKYDINFETFLKV